MPAFLKRSLLLRLGLAMASITILALVGMVTSVVIAELLRGQAAAINQAGSLRMQSFNITTKLLSEPRENNLIYGQAVIASVQEFEARLESTRLTNVLPRGEGKPLRIAYQQIAHEWRGDIKPLMDVYLHSVVTGTPVIDSQMRSELLSHINEYVQRIDRFVSLLEEDTESKINLLRLVQGVSLFLTLVIVYLTMYLMHTDVLTPLSALLHSAERARRGDFSARVAYAGDDELGRLGRAFNVMAEDLSKLYVGLESRVAAKTADLERSNRSLDLLYRTITQINEAPISEQTCTLLLKRVEKGLDLGPGAICLRAGVGGKVFNLASTGKTDSRYCELCGHSVCEQCVAHAESEIRTLPSGTRLFVTPLRDGQEMYGVMQFHLPQGVELAPWQTQLLETIGRHIALAVGALRRASESRRLALFEERGAIARELHDSLAQSLSYLKIQVTRLQSLLREGKGQGETDQVVHELREGLNGAYRQLRELLTTFRLKIDGRGLDNALKETVAEFARRATSSALSISLDNRLDGCPLTVNEEIHILQLVREALSNVSRHAHAREAHVSLQCSGDAVNVMVEDNGVGYTLQERQEPHHYGTIIMKERAHHLGGEITIERRAEGGTRVKLRFVPTERRRGTNNERLTAL